SGRLFGVPGPRYPKDGIHDYVIHGSETVNPDRVGTKCAARYKLTVPGHGSAVIRLRLSHGAAQPVDAGGGILGPRQREAGAAWDLAFHCIPLALVDSDFAKDQLVLLLREWYMHPNGQIPAYEWAFGDVNPPVFAWAAWRVYKIEKKRRGSGDRKFLKRVFHK